VNKITKLKVRKSTSLL